MKAAIILAGGAATRMRGVTKALADWEGRPMIAWVLDAITPHVSETLVMAGPRAPELRAIHGVRVLADTGRGPHHALHAAAHATRADTLLVAPADAPRLTSATYQTLLDAKAGHDGALYIEPGGHMNALVAVYDRHALLQAWPADSPRALAQKMHLARLDAAEHADALRDEDGDR